MSETSTQNHGNRASAVVETSLDLARRRHSIRAGICHARAVQRAQLLEFVASIGGIAQYLVDKGDFAGITIFQELQASEIWKTLKLRQLHVKKQISYSHLTQALKSRTSRYEQDRILGALGLISFPGMLVQDASLDEYLYQRAVDSGDFGALLFLGQPASLQPHVDCTWFLLGRNFESEQHQLMLKGEGISLVDVGRDIVVDAHCVEGRGTLRHWAQTSDHALSLEPFRAAQIARAWGMPEYSALSPDGTIGSGYLATTTAMDLEPKQIYKQYYKPEFFQQYADLLPRASLKWLECHYLQMKLDYSALAVIWTEASGPQLAVLTEPINDFDGNFVILTPGSYVTNPGPGCLVCKRAGPMRYRKVGIGIGDSLKASGLVSLVLVP
jgi:hypothetical protein